MTKNCVLFFVKALKTEATPCIIFNKTKILIFHLILQLGAFDNFGLDDWFDDGGGGLCDDGGSQTSPSLLSSSLCLDEEEADEELVEEKKQRIGFDEIQVMFLFSAALRQSRNFWQP